jgi:ribosomal protein S18 acetylase RimI-like enzyme
MNVTSGSVAAADGAVEVIRFDPAYREDFRRLNLAWLERYFKVEPIDQQVLGSPETEILLPGGEVLFARLCGHIVGTVALRYQDAATFELTKMAVDDQWQGRGFGSLLLESACRIAAERAAQRVILYSHRSLQAAIKLYSKHGFVPMVLEDQRYARCDIKMVRDLS